VGGERVMQVITEASCELEEVKGVLIAADEDYGPTPDTSPADVVKRILAERDALKNTITQLQQDNNRLVDERRAVDERYMVEHFHRIMPQPVLDVPQVPAEERVRLRLALITEEFFELIEACVQDAGARDYVAGAKTAFAYLTRGMKLEVDMVEFADACADLKYVIVGSELEFGIDGRPIFKGVHEANMRKVGGGKRADGKFLKPDGWTPFDVANELKRQGYREGTGE
jgi:predicted HAD superfamily Cof-like phosphohydrolase